MVSRGYAIMSIDSIAVAGPWSVSVLYVIFDRKDNKMYYKF